MELAITSQALHVFLARLPRTLTSKLASNLGSMKSVLSASPGCSRPGSTDPSAPSALLSDDMTNAEATQMLGAISQSLVAQQRQVEALMQRLNKGSVLSA